MDEYQKMMKFHLKKNRTGNPFPHHLASLPSLTTFPPPHHLPPLIPFSHTTHNLTSQPPFPFSTLSDRRMSDLRQSLKFESEQL